jgi:NAD(P) transhydrogenase
VLQLTNYRERFMGFRQMAPPTFEDLKIRVDWVRDRKVEVIRNRLIKRRVDIYPGWGRFLAPGKLGVFDDDGEQLYHLEGDYFLLAVGTVPFLRPGVPFDGRHFFYTDNVLSMGKVPRTLTVVGGGIIGSELASIFAALGTRVHLVDRRETFLPFLDRDIHKHLEEEFLKRRLKFHFQRQVEAARVVGDEAEVTLDDGTVLRTEKALFCEFRQTAVDSLNLRAVGVETTSRGLIKVDEKFFTSAPGILAAGDVIGSPGLASTSFEQGRAAALNAFHGAPFHLAETYPVGIYTIPEISYIGPPERELRQQGIPYVKGLALYRESARGAIMGAMDGVVKLLVHRDTRKVLAAHIVGDSSTELVHVAQAVIQHGGTVDYFVESVFNFPTLAETLKYAAISAKNQLAPK